MTETVLYTSTIQSPLLTSSPAWRSLVHEAAMRMPAEMLEGVGLTVGAVTITADDNSVSIRVAGKPHHPDDASVAAWLGDDDVRTLHSILGMILARRDAAEAA